MAANRALGVLECRGMVALAAVCDAMLKAADVRLCGRHGIGSGWLTVLVEGDTAAVQTAIRVAEREVVSYGELIASAVVPQPDQRATGRMPHAAAMKGASIVGDLALGVLETKGMTPLIQGADAMVKSADVELLGWAFIGGALVHVFVRGDAGPVETAVAAGRSAATDEGEVNATVVLRQPAEGLGELLPPLPEGDGQTVGALGVVETTGYAAAVSAHDGMIKRADVDIVRLTIGSGGRVAALVKGSLDVVRAAVEAGVEEVGRTAEVDGSCVVSSPDAAVMACFAQQQAAVEVPDASENPHLAMGLLETRSTVGLVAAVDVMLKSADVVHEGRYKVGYFLTAGIIRGDVGAVKTALDQGAAEARKHGELVAAHMIAQPFAQMEERLVHRQAE